MRYLLVLVLCAPISLVMHDAVLAQDATPSYVVDAPVRVAVRVFDLTAVTSDDPELVGPFALDLGGPGARAWFDETGDSERLLLALPGVRLTGEAAGRCRMDEEATLVVKALAAPSGVPFGRQADDGTPVVVWHDLGAPATVEVLPKRTPDGSTTLSVAVSAKAMAGRGAPEGGAIPTELGPPIVHMQEFRSEETVRTSGTSYIACMRDPRAEVGDDVADGALSPMVIVVEVSGLPADAPTADSASESVHRAERAMRSALAEIEALGASALLEDQDAIRMAELAGRIGERTEEEQKLYEDLVSRAREAREAYEQLRLRQRTELSEGKRELLDKLTELLEAHRESFREHGERVRARAEEARASLRQHAEQTAADIERRAHDRRNVTAEVVIERDGQPQRLVIKRLEDGKVRVLRPGEDGELVEAKPGELFMRELRGVAGDEPGGGTLETRMLRLAGGGRQQAAAFELGRAMAQLDAIRRLGEKLARTLGAEASEAAKEHLAELNTLLDEAQAALNAARDSLLTGVELGPIQMPELVAPKEIIGIGVSLAAVESAETGETEILVQYVVPGGPAERAGLEAGDVLISVDGEPVGASLPDLVPRIRGEEGTEVWIEVRRAGEEGTRTFTVTRERVMYAP